MAEAEVFADGADNPPWTAALEEAREAGLAAAAAAAERAVEDEQLASAWPLQWKVLKKKQGPQGDAAALERDVRSEAAARGQPLADDEALPPALLVTVRSPRARRRRR